jgi:hypothetical protein
MDDEKFDALCLGSSLTQPSNRNPELAARVGRALFEPFPDGVMEDERSFQ